MLGGGGGQCQVEDAVAVEAVKLVELVDPRAQFGVPGVFSHALVVHLVPAPAVGLIDVDGGVDECLLDEGAIFLIAQILPADAEDGDLIGEFLVDEKLVERRDELAPCQVTRPSEDDEQMRVYGRGHGPASWVPMAASRSSYDAAKAATPSRCSSSVMASKSTPTAPSASI